jgi:hypothetical protein
MNMSTSVETPVRAKAPDQTEQRKKTPVTTHSARIYVVCSPRPRVGKTLVARLLAEFFVMEGVPVAAFDLVGEGPKLADYLATATAVADIASTKGQMGLFDRLVADPKTSKIIDPGHRLFADFFGVVEKIGFFEEARRCAIEPVILFMVDPDNASAEAYAGLQQRFEGVTLVPVLNEAVAKGNQYRDLFPFAAASAVPLKIPQLPPAIKPLVDKPGFSFAGFRKVPEDTAPEELHDELQSWLKRALLEFRELELRLLLEELRPSLQFQL